MGYRTKIESLKIRLEDTLQKPKVIENTVVQEITVTCEKHGEYQTYKRKLLSLRGMETQGECPECLREKIIALEQEYQAVELKRVHQEKLNLLKFFNVPKRFDMASLDNYEPINSYARQCLAVCKSYAAKWPERLKQGGGLVMCGKPGTGKNHLAIGIGKSIIENFMASVRLTSAIKIARNFKATWTKDSEERESDVIEMYASPDLLIIDEVGVQFGSDVEKMILFEIINCRYENLKPTILISNLLKEELATFVGERVMDRMNDGGGCTLTFTWESYRSRKKAA
ncbi:ATP-binding protein [Candidatus Arsenophonus triatominarum]|uniref:ATP-binding protein n=2 Tax=Candidatus Arsenophonus triatominarum TaxID=57911 RepID=UPI0007C4FFB6|nr:ATP-binding protein [Candidatus Arsenophonus triatominarum]